MSRREDAATITGEGEVSRPYCGLCGNKVKVEPSASSYGCNEVSRMAPVPGTNPGSGTILELKRPPRLWEASQLRVMGWKGQEQKQQHPLQQN